MIKILYRSRRNYQRVPYISVQSHVIMTYKQCIQERIIFEEYNEAFFESQMLVLISFALSGIPISINIEHSFIHNDTIVIIFKEVSYFTRPSAFEFCTFLYETKRNEQVDDVGMLILRKVI